MKELTLITLELLVLALTEKEDPKFYRASILHLLNKYELINLRYDNSEDSTSHSQFNSQREEEVDPRESARREYLQALFSNYKRVREAQELLQARQQSGL